MNKSLAKKTDKKTAISTREARLARLLRPRSIAACGGKEAAQVIQQCLKMGYRGKIFPIHPRKKSVCGIPCFASVKDLPVPPDVAFLGVNHKLSIELTRELQAMQAGGVVCYAAGFSETQREVKDGYNLQQQLLEAADDMPLFGPNCYGFVNCLDSIAVWPDQHAAKKIKRGVAILTQSSNIAMNLSMQQRGVPLAFFASMGNQAQIGMLEIAQNLIEDKRISAIALLIEGITEIERLLNLAERARAIKKPIVVLKLGQSEQAKRATFSHTASIAGAHEATAAALKRLGVGQVKSLPVLMEVLKILHSAGPLNSAKISSMSCSGGEAALIADAAHKRKKIQFPKLSAKQHSNIKKTLSHIVSVDNPLDYHTFIWAKQNALTRTFSAMLTCNFDLHLLIIDFPNPTRCSDKDWIPSALALKDAVKATNARAAVVATLHENMPQVWADKFMQQGIAPLYGIEEALDAIEVAAEIGSAWLHLQKNNRKEKASNQLFLRASNEKVKLAQANATRNTILLDEASAKTLLAQHGIPVPRGQVIESSIQACEFQQKIGLPVVIKALGIPHKSEVSALELNLNSHTAIEKSCARLQKFAKKLLVEEQISGAVCELLLGITRDEQFGLMLTIAAGGRLVELMQDKVTLPLPITRSELLSALESLPVMPLLKGYRGAPAGDIEAFLRLGERVSDFAEKNEASLIELDLNPVIVRTNGCKDGSAAIAADALVRLTSS